MLKSHHLIAEQTQRPTRTTFRRRSTGQGDQMCLRFAIQLPLVHPLARLGVQRRFQPLFDEPLTNTLDTGTPTPQRLDNLGI